MLSNAYFLAKFRFDTAENEPAKNLQNFANFPNFANPGPRTARPRCSQRALLGAEGAPNWEEFGAWVHETGELLKHAAGNGYVVDLRSEVNNFE